MVKQNQPTQSGFTLVELAIVLVIIGLILGMAFKGKDLIDGAKVKSIATQYNKIQAAFNIYFERYGAYPGDGCGLITLGQAFVPCAGAKNGLLNTAQEANAAIILLQNANLLSAADVQSPFGVPWAVSVSTSAFFPPAGTNYLSFTTAAAVPLTAAAAVADSRFVCALDRLIDNGDSGAAAAAAGTTVRSTTAPLYTNATDCWARTGTVNVGLRLLP
ncbi:type II secretion system protein [Iodobacter arcticus]|uniref:Type II secretion system protein n=1 Tax=Iodobacter arcticus TaxID=590593 RepID=A0ABW2R030_9NEIS